MTSCYRSEVKWIIKDYSVHVRAADAIPLKSDVISFDGKPQIKWMLEANVRGPYAGDSLDEESEWLSLKLCLSSDELDDINEINVDYYIYNRDCEEIPVGYYRLTVPNKNHEWISVMRNNDLLNDESCLLSNDTLTIIARILAIARPFSITEPEIEVPKCMMRDYMGEILETGDFSDVTLVACGQKMAVHKVILATNSIVFWRMFRKSETMKDKQNEVHINDVNAEVLREMIRFMYTGKTMKLEEMANELHAVADKYHLWRLKALCDEEIVKQTLTKRTDQL